MSNIKFCRFTSNCGPQSKCKGNLFGLIRGKCVSTKGTCRWDSNCPAYYQCAGNQGGLTEGKCLLAISKSNPLSKSLGNISTSLLDPASQYRRMHTVNWMMTIIIFAILGGIGYYVYFSFLKPTKASPGTCYTSQDCAVEGPGGQNVLFQCGQKIYNFPDYKKGSTGRPATGPQLTGVVPNVCDCTTLHGAGYSGMDTMYKQGGNPNWLFDTGEYTLSSPANCKTYFDKQEQQMKFPHTNTPVPITQIAP